MVDHNLLLPLYNGMDWPKQARVDRLKMKLEAYCFNMEWEQGHSNSCDYGSWHPPEDSRAVEADDDNEIFVNCILKNKLPTTITQKLQRTGTLKDPVMQALVEDKAAGECRTALHRYQYVFHDLTIVNQIVIWQL